MFVCCFFLCLRKTEIETDIGLPYLIFGFPFTFHLDFTNMQTVLYLLPCVWHLFVVHSNRPTVGIIRWDAWNLVDNTYDEISYYLHRDMSPSHWHYRLPFYVNILPDNSISFNNDNQSIIDKEILYAHSAGIDYFAFDFYCKYEKNCSVSSTNKYGSEKQCNFYSNTTSTRYCPENPTYGLDLYLESQYKDLINFTLILLGSIPCSDNNISQLYVNYMLDNNFHTVLDNRPLIYLFQFSDNEAEACGGWNNSKIIFDNIRNAAIKAGLNNPYMVLMDFVPETVYENAVKLGFDAISTYALPGGNINGTMFRNLTNAANKWWYDSLEYNFDMVPIIPTGWDPRPRYENPVPWCYEGPQHYFQPTTDELNQLVQTAVNFTCLHKNNATQAKTMIMYAWNECSENGACIIPTIGNGTVYVDSLATVLPSSAC